MCVRSHIRRKTQVAVKVLLTQLSSDQLYAFLNEARVFRLKHPANQIQRLLRAFLKIGKRMSDRAARMGIVTAVEPDFRHVRRKCDQWAAS